MDSGALIKELNNMGNVRISNSYRKEANKSSNLRIQ